MSLPKPKQTVLCVLLALGLDKAIAAPAWNCQKGADGKEWVCLTGKAAKPAEEGRAEPGADTAKPSPVEATPTPAVEAAKPRMVEPAARPAEMALPQPADLPSARPPIAAPAPSPDRTAQPALPAASDGKPVRPVLRKDEPEEKPIAQTVGKTDSPSAHAANLQDSAKTGWNCRPGSGKEWDCALAGQDPGGEAHVVGESSAATANWKQSSDMTREDEQRFSSILARMPANPWALGCGRSKREWSKGTDFLLSDADQLLREQSPLEIVSERAEMLHGEASNFQGAAELVRADQRLYGNFVTHNKESGTLNAQGNVVYREKGLAFASDTAFMKLNTDEGILRNAQFVLETVPARGTARVAHLDSKSQSRYETATYTTCPPGDQDWLLHATHVSLDKDAGRGVATNAWLEFKGVPFLYTPYISFPIDDRRKSGFLTPFAGLSKLNGFDFTLPYYFNLAPNYDLTVMARYMSNRGELLRGDFRYLTELGRGRLFADILPYDRIKDEGRSQVGWVDDSRFTDKLSSHMDLHLVSDPRYIYELGGLLAINNTTFLRSWGDIRYNGGELLGGWYSANVLVDYYQSMDPTILRTGYPHRRLPQINFNFGREIAGTGLQFQTSVEATRFDQQYIVNGERLNIRPRLYYPFRDAAGYITPSLAVQHTEYWLSNLGAGEASSFTRTAPIFSVDSGAYFERNFDLFNVPMQQTLEPRLFYLYVPKVDQPYNYNNGLGLNFDTNEYDFNFYQLFRENRFAGLDRLSDANNITPALTTRFISQESGLERLKLSVGKVFYLTQPKVVLVPNGPQTTVKGNLVGEVSSMLSDHWSLRGTGQWNPGKGRIDRGQVALQYNDYANNLLNLSYRYRRDPYDGSIPPYPVDPNNPNTINQTDISTRLPLGAGWFFIGRWQYDLGSQVTVETMAGVERETCCWRFSLIGLRYINGVLGQVVTSDNVASNNAVFFQVELKGLGRIGDQVDNLLARNFSGYRTDNDLPNPYP